MATSTDKVAGLHQVQLAPADGQGSELAIGNQRREIHQVPAGLLSAVTGHSSLKNASVEGREQALSNQGNSSPATSATTSGNDLPRTSSADDEDEVNSRHKVPSPALAEEERLGSERQEREQQEMQQALQANPDLAGPLHADRHAKLLELLNKSEQFTQFLAEQLKAIDAQKVLEEKQHAAKGAVTHTEGAARVAEDTARQRGRTRGRKRSRPAAEEPPKAKRARADVVVDAATKELCPGLHAELRDYQLQGVKWLISLWQNGVNGILADQMGLGKTVQTIAFLDHLKSKGVYGPFLVVAPLSTLTNWADEIRRFCPSMEPLLYYGPKDERTRLQHDIKSQIDARGHVPPDFPVICTSYETVLADIHFLQKIKWKYVVVDEGHRLKNFDCKLIKELRLLSADNKLLLTGTPLQNSLAELWSLLNFLMPDIFSSLSDFESWFDFSSMIGQGNTDKELVALEQRNHIISKLHSILRPFVLRRVKSDVEMDLPRKQEVILYAAMTDEQHRINRQLLEGNLKEEMSRAAQDEGRVSSIPLSKLNNVLMQMRKNANHPYLITSEFSNDPFFPPVAELLAQSGKMQLLDRLLTRLLRGGHKVLIFSQMTTMLDILEYYLEQQGQTLCRIDGSVHLEQRRDDIKAFHTDPKRQVFLLSTRAGGLGINLTAADTVIIYDSDWNPQQDLQAMDRCHRIGQTRPVLVFRLATANSIEGKMLRRAGQKLTLERLVIKKGAFKRLVSEEDARKRASLSATELMELLKSEHHADDVLQTGVVSDQVLDRLLERAHLMPPGGALPLPPSGVGYEVVAVDDGSGVLKGVND